MSESGEAKYTKGEEFEEARPRIANVDKYGKIEAFREAQYPYARELGPEFDGLREDYDEFRQLTADFVLNKLSEDFPSMEEIVALNEMPQNKAIESLIEKAKKNQEQHQHLLEEHFEDDMFELVMSHRAGHPDELAAPDIDARMNNRFLEECTTRGFEYEDIADRVSYADLQTLLDLQKEKLKLRNQETLGPLSRLISFTNKFPRTILEYQGLSVFATEKQRQVARFLTTTEVAERSAVLAEGGWTPEDVGDLVALFESNLSFREEVKELLYPALPLFTDSPSDMAVDD